MVVKDSTDGQVLERWSRTPRWSNGKNEFCHHAGPESKTVPKIKS